jgi:uncharacterized peroxidase-related enzyme
MAKEPTPEGTFREARRRARREHAEGTACRRLAADAPRSVIVAHIELGLKETDFPGITGLMRFRPETAVPLNALADALLSAPHPTLSRGERELIAAYTSSLNECDFCATSHSAFAAAQLDGGIDLVTAVRADADAAAISPKMKALLRIAAKVQQGGRKVTLELADAARAEGATDLEIHDTVLIAAAFCMFNRYVDGLGTIMPEDPIAFEEAAERVKANGYIR